MATETQTLANRIVDLEARLQTNGVRQGSPDSPVVFSGAIGETLDEVLQELQPVPRQGDNPKLPPSPQGGASFLDDTYLWSHTRNWLVKALALLEEKLGKKNLSSTPRRRSPLPTRWTRSP